MMGWRYKLEFDRPSIGDAIIENGQPNSKCRRPSAEFWTVLRRRRPDLSGQSPSVHHQKAKRRCKLLIEKAIEVHRAPPNDIICKCLPPEGFQEKVMVPPPRRSRLKKAGTHHAHQVAYPGTERRPHSAPSEVIEERLRVQRQKLLSQRRQATEVDGRSMHSLVELVDGDCSFEGMADRNAMSFKRKSRSLPRIKDGSLSAANDELDGAIKTKNIIPASTWLPESNSGPLVKCVRAVKRVSSSLSTKGRKSKVRINASQLSPKLRHRHLSSREYNPFVNPFGMRLLSSYRMPRFIMGRKHRSCIFTNGTLNRRVQCTCIVDEVSCDEKHNARELHQCRSISERFTSHAADLMAFHPIAAVSRTSPLEKKDCLSKPSVEVIPEGEAGSDKESGGGHETDEGVYTHDEAESVASGSSKERLNIDQAVGVEVTSTEASDYESIESLERKRSCVQKTPSFKSQISIGAPVLAPEITISPATIFVSCDLPAFAPNRKLEKSTLTSVHIKEDCFQEPDSLECERSGHSLPSIENEEEITDSLSSATNLASLKLFKAMLQKELSSVSSSEKVESFQSMTSSVFVNKIPVTAGYSADYFTPLEPLIEESGEYISSSVNSLCQQPGPISIHSRMQGKDSRCFQWLESNMDDSFVEIQSQSMEFSGFEANEYDSLEADTTEYSACPENDKGAQVEKSQTCELAEDVNKMDKLAVTDSPMLSPKTKLYSNEDFGEFSKISTENSDESACKLPLNEKLELTQSTETESFELSASSRIAQARNLFCLNALLLQQDTPSSPCYANVEVSLSSKFRGVCEIKPLLNQNAATELSSTDATDSQEEECFDSLNRTNRITEQDEKENFLDSFSSSGHDSIDSLNSVMSVLCGDISPVKATPKFLLNPSATPLTEPINNPRETDGDDKWSAAEALAVDRSFAAEAYGKKETLITDASGTCSSTKAVIDSLEPANDNESMSQLEKSVVTSGVLASVVDTGQQMLLPPPSFVEEARNEPPATAVPDVFPLTDVDIASCLASAGEEWSGVTVPHLPAYYQHTSCSSSNSSQNEVC